VANLYANCMQNDHAFMTSLLSNHLHSKKVFALGTNRRYEALIVQLSACRRVRLLGLSPCQWSGYAPHSGLVAQPAGSHPDRVPVKAARSRYGKIRILARIETVDPDAKYYRYDERSAPEY